MKVRTDFIINDKPVKYIGAVKGFDIYRFNGGDQLRQADDEITLFFTVNDEVQFTINLGAGCCQNTGYINESIKFTEHN